MRIDQDPIFKGGIAIATIFGIPLLFFVLAAMATVPLVLVALTLFGPGGGLVMFAVFVLAMQRAQKICKHDQHRLHQAYRRTLNRWRHRANLRAWGSVTYSPFRRK